MVSQVWWPERAKATLFLFHGFYDHTGLYRHVIEWALDQGFAVIACDLPGHGLSSGERASIKRFRRVSGHAARACSPKRIARSAATVAPVRAEYRWRHRDRSCAQRGGEQSGPGPGDPVGAAGAAAGVGLVATELLPARGRLVKAIARRFSENSNDPEFLPFLQADPLQPLRLPTAWVGALARWIKRVEAAPASTRRPLIVQGQADMTVDWQHNLEVLKAKFDRPQVLMLPEARHHLANETLVLRGSISGFERPRIQGPESLASSHALIAGRPPPAAHRVVRTNTVSCCGTARGDLAGAENHWVRFGSTAPTANPARIAASHRLVIRACLSADSRQTWQLFQLLVRQIAIDMQPRVVRGRCRSGPSSAGARPFNMPLRLTGHRAGRGSSN